VTYGCDCPVYAYANLPPDQVVVNVQESLQDQGYYAGTIDGQLGQQTRDALGQYQKEHDLEITSAIDEPTVQALGLDQQA
jgi:localization factor PodJL